MIMDSEQLTQLCRDAFRIGFRHGVANGYHIMAEDVLAQANRLEREAFTFEANPTTEESGISDGAVDKVIRRMVARLQKEQP